MASVEAIRAPPAIARTTGARTTTWLTWFAVLPLYGWLVARFDHVIDDAFITFRYARHLAHGLGLCWNPGVDPPVEGFSSPLWVLLLAPVEFVGADPGVAARVLAIACGAAVLRAMAAVLLDGLRLTPLAAFAGLAVAACMPPFAVWSTSGLETMAFVLLLVSTYERLFNPAHPPDGRGAALTGTLAFLCRFDAIGWIAVCLAVAWIEGRRRRIPALASAARRASVAIAIGCAAIELARIAYFHDWLPNAARTKLDPGSLQVVRGLLYLARFATVFPLVPLLALGVWSVRRHLTSIACTGAAAMSLATVAHALFVGGDFMSMFRFLVPAIPFGAILFAAALDGVLRERAGRRFAIASLSVLVIGAGLLPAFGYEPARLAARRIFAADRASKAPATQSRELAENEPVLRRWIAMAKRIAGCTAREASFVRSSIGAFGYYSERTVFDVHGLVDRELAHARFEDVANEFRPAPGHDRRGDLAFFEPRKPTYAWTSMHRRDELERANPELVARIFPSASDRAFLGTYRPLVIPMPDYDDGQWFLLLAERTSSPHGADNGVANDGVADNGWYEPLLAPRNLRPPVGR